MANKLLTENLLEALDGAKSARIEIDSGPGHLTIDELTGGEPVLASGTLEYLEKQGAPTETLEISGGQAALTVRAGEGSTRRSWLRLPWDACGGGAYEWQIHLNPTVPSDISANSHGGNVRLDLAHTAVIHLTVDNGGGNVDVVLPDQTSDLAVSVKTGAGNVAVDIGRDVTGHNSVEASSGAGNVVVGIPTGLAARIHSTSGWGKVIVDPRFSQADKDTHQSPDYESAANRVELTLSSGAGNVSVNTR